MAATLVTNESAPGHDGTRALAERLWENGSRRRVLVRHGSRQVAAFPLLAAAGLTVVAPALMALATALALLTGCSIAVEKVHPSTHGAVTAGAQVAP